MLRFVLTIVAYLIFAGQVSLGESVAAFASAAAVTLLSLIAHRSRPPRFHFVPSVIATQLLGALPKLLTDSVSILPRLLGTRTGTMSQEFLASPSHEHDPAWWAGFILTTSLPPNSYLVSRLSRPGEVIVHRLVEPRGT